jgi:microcystin-dependent protein
MAKARWTIGYPVDFSAYGDRTFEAIQKECIQEIEKIYGHLNDLRYSTANFANIVIKGAVLDQVGLPASAGAGDIWAVAGDPPTLYAWTGTRWQLLSLSFPVPATQQKPGTVMIGSIVDAVGLTPSFTKVITEKQLAEYSHLGSAGVLVGSIVMWHGAASTIPDGWLYCDGTNGTPDLRGLFIRGGETVAPVSAREGADTFDVPPSTLPEHEHKLTIARENDGHTHEVKLSTGVANTNHDHVIDAVNTSLSGGLHQHQPQYGGQNAGFVEYAGYQTHNKPNVGNPSGYYRADIDDPPPPSGPWQAYVAGGGEHVHPISGTITLAQTKNTEHAHVYDGSTALNVGEAVKLSGETMATQEELHLALDARPAFVELVFMMKAEVPIYG